MKRAFAYLLITAALSTVAGCSSEDHDSYESVTPMTWEGDTTLPPFTGKPAAAQPLDPAAVPQNPFMARNPFSNYHNDTWMSDTFDIAGPLGRAPKSWSSNLQAARDPGAPNDLFLCGTLAFDTRGRIVTICSNSVQSTALLLDPESLAVKTSINLPVAGNMQAALGAGYMMLDNLDRAWSPVGNKLVVVSQNGSAENTSLSWSKYDLSGIPSDGVINSLVPDNNGRIWFVVRNYGMIGVLDTATNAVKTVQLNNEEISNSFAVNGTDAYIVTTKQMYRFTAGSDNVPTVVWSADYKNINQKKPGQLSAGSGTTPTLLGQGKYVAIADNDYQTHVVVYRTDAPLGAGVERKICEVEVFEPGKGAVEDSLIGSGLSLIVSNNFGFSYVPQNFVDFGSVPGMSRVDIKADGSGCEKIWTNTVVNPASYGAKLSTKSGLAYVVARKTDSSRPTADYPNGMNVWYWTAIDFRTGTIAWEQLAGTGRWFDGYWPLPFLGPNGYLYMPANGGIFAMKDTY